MHPMRALPGFYIDKASADPRGMTVVGVDGVAGGSSATCGSTASNT